MGSDRNSDFKGGAVLGISQGGHMVTEVLFHGSYVTFDRASSSVYLLWFCLLVRANTRTHGQEMRVRVHWDLALMDGRIPA